MAMKTQATIDDVGDLSPEGERYELIDGKLVPIRPLTLATQYQFGG
jgi:hypothetical protein